MSKKNKNDFITATVSVECETEEELVAHFKYLAHQIEQRIKKSETKSLSDGSGDATVTIDDSNCYGTHVCIINIPK